MEIKNIYKELDRVTPDEKAGIKVAWESEFPVEKGDCFSIPEKTVHHLVNTGTVRLCALFICSPSHLSTDRFFVGD